MSFTKAFCLSQLQRFIPGVCVDFRLLNLVGAKILLLLLLLLLRIVKIIRQCLTAGRNSIYKRKTLVYPSYPPSPSNLHSQYISTPISARIHACTCTHTRTHLLNYSETRQLHSHVLKCLYYVNKGHLYYHYISPLSRLSVVE